MPDAQKKVPSAQARPKTILRSRLREQKEVAKTKLKTEAAAEAAQGDDMMKAAAMPAVEPPVRSGGQRELVYIDTRPPLRTPTFSGGSSGASKPNRRRRR
ncbi:hypothetical protein HY633_01030 [Candidatus Uhrbacteria bacterium]|nr:hypothetical protein [Candidatus Uhrbacteria bacterium]